MGDNKDVLENSKVFLNVNKSKLGYIEIYKSIIEQKTINDDIFNCKENIIVHQVNMKKQMGAGLAKQIKNRYPNVYEQYINHDGKLGEVQLVPASFKIDITNFPSTIPTKYIANLYSENNYGNDGKLYTKYDAMRKGFKELAYHIIQSNECGNNMSLAIPYKIGCGYGGGDWEIVSQIIVEELEGNIEYRIYKK